jgi:hypothetical protein
VTVRAVDDGPRPRWDPPARENRNLAIALCATVIAAAPASADSIVYAKQGDLFLA